MPQMTHAEEPQDGLHFIAIGDWGAPPGNSDSDKKKRRWQARLAQEATAYIKNGNITPTALLALGDNFYGTLSGVSDSRWQWGLEDLYPAADWACPIPFILGNHDYEEPEQAGPKDKNYHHEIAYARLPGKRWSWDAQGTDTWYRRDFTIAGQPLITFLMLDTNTDHLRAPNGALWTKQMAWLDEEMKKTDKGPWVIPVAHQPMWSAGFHYDEDGRHRDPYDRDMYQILRKHLLPRLSTCPLYVSGHDHSLQHVTHPDYQSIDFLISGGGGGDYPQKRHALAKPSEIGFTSHFFESCFGFLHLHVKSKELTWKLVGFSTTQGASTTVFKSGTRTLI